MTPHGKIPKINILFGNIIGIRDTVSFHGESVSELQDAFHEAVDFYLETCEKANRKPSKPFSGKFLVLSQDGSPASSLYHEYIPEISVPAGFVSIGCRIVCCLAENSMIGKIQHDQSNTDRGMVATISGFILE